VLRPAGTGRHRPRRVRIRRRDHDAAGQLRRYGKTILFRTAPDTLLALYANAQVSFEADRLDEALHEGWSVLVHGHAHKVTDEREVKQLEDGMHREPWAGGARDVCVRIVPIRISGRRIQPSWASPPAAGAEP
jgi:Pyridoxamine 5'-phosphate oxidase